MKVTFDLAVDRAESTYDNNEDMKQLKPQAASALCEWFSENVMKKGAYRLVDPLTLLKPHNIELPALLTDRRQKEQRGYSSSCNLIGMINTLILVMHKKGYDKQSNSLQNTLDTVNRRMNQLDTADDSISMKGLATQRKTQGLAHSEIEQTKQCKTQFRGCREQHNTKYAQPLPEREIRWWH